MIKLDDIKKSIINAPEELKLLELDFSNKISSDVFNQLSYYVSIFVQSDIEPLRQVFDSRYSEAQALIEKSSSRMSGKNSKEYKKRLYTLMNPKAFYDDLNNALKEVNISKSYNKFFDSIEKTELSDISKRYRLSNNSLLTLQNLCLDAFIPTLDDLKSLFEIAKIHIGNLKSKQDWGFVKAGAKIATSIAGGMLGGIVGAYGARTIFNKVFNDDEFIKSEEMMVQKYFELSEVFTQSYNLFCDRIRYLEMSIIGGFLISLNNDLIVYNKKIAKIDLLKPNIYLELNEVALNDFKEWAEKVITQFCDITNKMEYESLFSASNKALSYVMSDSAFFTIVNKDNISYVVLFSRYRTMALNKIGNKLWLGGKIAEACSTYKLLFSNYNIAHDEISNETPFSDVSQSIGLYRLIIASTDKKLADSLSINNILEGIMRYYLMTLYRFQRDEYGSTFKGEQISYESIGIISLLKYYYEFISGMYLDIQLNVDGTNITLKTLENHFQKVYPHQLSWLLKKANAKVVKNSSFLKWASRKSFFRKLKIIFLILGAVALVFLTYYTFIINDGYSNIKEILSRLSIL